MPTVIVAFALGVLAVQHLPALPDPQTLRWVSILVAIGAALCGLTSRVPTVVGRRVMILLVACAAGFAWASWRAEWRLVDALPMQNELRDIEVIGVIDGLPQRLADGSLRFTLGVEHSSEQVPGRVQVSWYVPRGKAARDATALEVVPGERWQLVLRLKRPHGSANPGGFDYSRWLLERGIRATGYVRDSPHNRRLDEWVPGLMNGVHRLRASVRDRMERARAAGEHAGIVVALAIGDQRSIEPADWEVFRRTATGHLVAISGLHVSLVALFAGGLAGWCWRRHPRSPLYVPAQRVAVCVGLFAAAGYALLAGLGLPTQRAVIMLAVAALAIVSGREVAAGRVLALALGCVVLIDPWAVTSAGFWLSFGAVAVIVLVLAGRSSRPTGWRAALRVQVAITLVLAPVLLALFNGFSVVGPLANALAIPAVSLLVAPAVLLSLLVPFAWPLELAHTVTGWMMDALAALAGLPVALWAGPDVPWMVLAAALIGCAWLVLPRATPGRFAAVLAIVPMLVWSPPRPAEGSFRATVLDVGQGLAVHVQTASHDLLFDAGPDWGGDADAGERIVVPYLNAQAVRRLDAMVLSHGDGDHVGGAAAVFAAMPAAVLWFGAGVAEADYPARAHAACTAGQVWHWDGVEFAVLHPGGDRAGDRNDASCVLRIRASGGVMLLTGDIGKRAERALVARAKDALASSVVVVPHHGSGGSSSPSFVAATGAAHAIHSVGNLNRYRHPHPDVWARWASAGARNWRTDAQGAIVVSIGPVGAVVEAHRERAARYWHGR